MHVFLLLNVCMLCVMYVCESSAFRIPLRLTEIPEMPFFLFFDMPHNNHNHNPNNNNDTHNNTNYRHFNPKKKRKKITSEAPLFKNRNKLKK